MTQRNLWTSSVLLAALVLAASAFALQNQNENSKTVQGAGPAAPPQQEPRVVVLNITSGPDKVFQLVTAFHVAEDAIADGRHVVLFFNGDGMQVPLKRFPPELRLGDERPVWRMLHDLVERGVEIVVSREAARILGLVPADFVVNTQIRDWGGAIFEKMPSNTVVFTF